MPVQITPILVAITSLEIGLYVAGLFLFWRFQFGAKAGMVKSLPAWDLSPVSLAQAILCVIGAALVFQIAVDQIVRLCFRAAVTNRDFLLIVGGGSFQVGSLIGIFCTRWVLRPDERLASSPTLLTPPPAIAPAIPAGKIIPASFATFLVVLPLLAVLGYVWQWFLTLCHIKIEKQELLGIFGRAHSSWLVFAMVSLAVIIAPVTEELAFRAGLFRFLRTRVPRAVALIVPAAIFASIHGNLAAFPSLTLLGIVFSLAYERTGRISVPIIAHGLFNLHTLLLLLSGIDL